MEIGSSVLSSRHEVQGFFSAVAGKWYEQLSDNYLMTSLALPSLCVTISLILSNNLNVSHVGYFFCQPSLLSHTTFAAKHLEVKSSQVKSILFVNFSHMYKT